MELERTLRGLSVATASPTHAKTTPRRQNPGRNQAAPGQRKEDGSSIGAHPPRNASHRRSQSPTAEI